MDRFSRIDSDSLLSDLENSMDTMPGTPLSKCVDMDQLDQSITQVNTTLVRSLQNQVEPQTPQATLARTGNSRRDSRIRSETMLSRVGSFASVTDLVSVDDMFEYEWADSDSESPNGKYKESYMVQELLADFLKIKSFKRKYPDMSRRTMDAYERSWLQQEGLVPMGRADLGLTALRSDEVFKLIQSDYPDIHPALSDLFRRRRFQKTAELQKRQYEAARIERGEARAEAARRRALDSALDYNHRFVQERLTNRRCYWDLQTMQIHLPQRVYKLLESRDHPHGAYPVAVIPGQFAEHYAIYTPEQLMHLPLARCLHSEPARKHRPPPPLPTNLRFGSVQPRPVVSSPIVEESRGEGDPMRTTAECVDPSVAALKNENRNSPISMDRPTDPGTLGNPSMSSGIDRKGTSELSTETKQCHVCKQTTQLFIQCSECGHAGHPKCLDISDVMLPSVRSYSWSCMECKRCVECSDPGHEEQMMFCDKCDRGYHAFCVGLQTIPAGRWECPLCTGRPVNNTARASTPKSRRTSRPASRAKKPRVNRAKPNRRRSTPAKRESISESEDASESASEKPRKRVVARRGKRTPASSKLATKPELKSSPKPDSPDVGEVPNPAELTDSAASDATTTTTMNEAGPVKRKRGRPRLTIGPDSPEAKRRYRIPVSRRKSKMDPSISPSIADPSVDTKKDTLEESMDASVLTAESPTSTVTSPSRVEEETVAVAAAAAEKTETTIN